MLKEHKRTIIITSLVTLLPVLIGLILWKKLPDPMAMHFGSLSMEKADGYGSKAFAVFGLPLILLAVHWSVICLLCFVEPKRQEVSPKVLDAVLWLFPVIALAVAAMVYLYNLNIPFDFAFIWGLLVGLFLIVIGNYLPKTRQNYTVGYRIPWTLKDADNWNRTHRLAGRVWVLCGLALTVLTFCRVTGPLWMVGALALCIVIPTVYSFLLSRKKAS